MRVSSSQVLMQVFFSPFLFFKCARLNFTTFVASIEEFIRFASQ